MRETCHVDEYFSGAGELSIFRGRLEPYSVQYPTTNKGKDKPHQALGSLYRVIDRRLSSLSFLHGFG